LSAAAVRLARTAFLLLGAALGGCAFVPHDYPRLNEVRAERALVHSDGPIARHAPGELLGADEVLARAGTARDTLDDPAVVDHLAYLARQRLAIARESARLREALEEVRALEAQGSGSRSSAL
jgi:hypothetical protein